MCGGVRVVSLYAPNGRAVDSPFYEAKLAWFDRLARWLARGARAAASRSCSAATSTSRPTTSTCGTRAPATAERTSRAPEREAFARLCEWGLVDAYRAAPRPSPERYTWWDYRAGNFHKNFGMRIDHLLVTAPVASRASSGPRSIARRARASRSPRTTRRSCIDLDEPGHPFDAGWAAPTSASPRAARVDCVVVRRRTARAIEARGCGRPADPAEARAPGIRTYLHSVGRPGVRSMC